jgi:hypothetical protein
MKVTNFGPNGLPITLAGWSTGVVSLNSNVEIIGGGLAALNFVQRITSNTSNTLLNPIVNFAAGSNIALSAQSNTITITGAAGGGAAAVISAGSNSTRVREVSTAGASTTLWSPFDHAHDGIGTITASSSNTMQRGTWNIRAGTGIALALTDADGDGEFDTTTIVATGGGGGSGSGALTLLATTLLGADAADITITGLSGSYRDLILHADLRSVKTAVSDDFRLRVGSGSIDTASNYEYNFALFGSVTSTGGSTTDATFYYGPGAAASATSETFSFHEYTIANYASTTQNRMLSGNAALQDAGTNGRLWAILWGRWRNSANAIDQVRVYADGGNLKAGSRLTVYGRG